MGRGAAFPGRAVVVWAMGSTNALVAGLSGSSGQVASPYAGLTAPEPELESAPATPVAIPLAAAMLGTGRRRVGRRAAAPTVEPGASGR